MHPDNVKEFTEVRCNKCLVRLVRGGAPPAVWADHISAHMAGHLYEEKLERLRWEVEEKQKVGAKE